MFNKLTDKVDMDEISTKLKKNWLDRIINLIVTCSKASLFDFVISVSISFVLIGSSDNPDTCR